jgi:hypothetical protein
MAYAHSRNESGERQDLRHQLDAVAQLAEELAAPFGGGTVTRLASYDLSLKLHPPHGAGGN